MSQFECRTVLDSQSTGINGPLYFDGAVIEAADLTLDRTSHTQALWRLRRYLHGWGIVAGLTARLDTPLQGATLTVEAGYGIAADGEEIFLPKPVLVKDMVDRLLATCGPNAAGCGLNEEEGAAVTPQTPLTGWIVARSGWTHAAPRAGLPQDCAHPGTNTSPTRACNQVTIELHCDLPQGHDTQTADCDTIKSIICGGAAVPLSLTQAEGHILVLGRINWNGKTVSYSPAARRRLLPVSILQDFATQCLCEPPPPPPDPTPDEPTPDPPAKPDQIWVDIFWAWPLFKHRLGDDFDEQLYLDTVQKLQDLFIHWSSILEDPEAMLGQVLADEGQFEWFIDTTAKMIEWLDGFKPTDVDLSFVDFYETHKDGLQKAPETLHFFDDLYEKVMDSQLALTLQDLVGGDPEALSDQLGLDPEVIVMMAEISLQVVQAGSEVKF